MSRRSFNKSRLVRPVAATAAMIGLFLGGASVNHDFEAAMKSARSTPSYEFPYGPDQAQLSPGSTSLAGMAVEAYLDGLKTGLTDKKDVTDHGKKLKAKIALSGGAVVTLAVDSGSARNI